MTRPEVITICHQRLDTPANWGKTPDMKMSRTGLIEAYHSYGSPESDWRIGAEFERHLLDAKGTPLPYFGEPGIQWLMNLLAEEDGWDRTMEDGHIIALAKDGARVTLEPGGQFELSGAPFPNVTGVDAELKIFNHRIDEILLPHGYRQVALGFTPIAPIPDIPWVPKGRYSIMRDHLIKTGELAHHMMKGTCATQASYDFSDEADCARKVQLAIGLGPLTTALFANSPLDSGKDTGMASFRGHIWTKTDPRRCGFPEAAQNFSYEAWVDYLLDVPMMFIYRGGTYQWAKGRTFRDWLKDPTDPPNEHDWDLHLTSVFPEVRIKQTIEVRGADCVDRPLAMAFSALFEGLFYCTKGMDDALALNDAFLSAGTKEERFAIACRDGLTGVIGGRRLSDWAADLVDIGRAALERCRPMDVVFLDALTEVVDSGESPSAVALNHWRAANGNVADFLKRVDVER